MGDWLFNVEDFRLVIWYPLELPPFAVSNNNAFCVYQVLCLFTNCQLFDT